MPTKEQTPPKTFGKIALLTTVIVLAIMLIVVSLYRSNQGSGTIQPQVRQMKASARGRKAAP